VERTNRDGWRPHASSAAPSLAPRYNAIVHQRWLAADEIAAWLRALPHSANSGDAYARLL
jgi:hypothetical protein